MIFYLLLALVHRSIQEKIESFDFSKYLKINKLSILKFQPQKVAMIAPDAAARGIPVCEINLDVTPKTSDFEFHFHGKSGVILPELVSQL